MRIELCDNNADDDTGMETKKVGETHFFVPLS